MKSTPPSLGEIESELLNSLFANLFSYLIQLFTKKLMLKLLPFALGVSYPFYTKSCIMHLERLSWGRDLSLQCIWEPNFFIPEHKLKPPQRWVRLYISAQHHKSVCRNTRLMEIKTPAPCVWTHRTTPCGWLNMPNTRMLKSQIIVIWSSVHVLSSVQTSILLCLPTQKPGKWIPKFKHCNYRGNAEMKQFHSSNIFTKFKGQGFWTPKSHQ